MSVGLRVTFHVFTTDGDLYVDGSNDGGRALQSLVTQYPDATVITEDRDTGEALADETTLIRLLGESQRLMVLTWNRTRSDS
jgi:hypothetical protein